MAVGSLPSVNTQPLQPGESRDVRAAQRAFFEAALSRTGAAAPVQAAPATFAAAAVQAAAPAKAATVAEPAPQPARHYRPGALLDIKI